MIQPRLGHALITETMDTYGHLFPGSEDLGRGAVEAALRDALAEQEGSVSAKMQLWGAEDKDHALAAARAFGAAYGAKFPKAAAKITDDLDQLLAFCDYPCEHWLHVRTTNPIESTVATVRQRTTPNVAAVIGQVRD